MKQNIKRILLVLCMAACFFALSACSSADSETSEPIPQEIEETMRSGAESYLEQFAGFDDAALAEELKTAQKQKNTVMESAISSWISSKDDLGAMKEIVSVTVERDDEESYTATVVADFEKRGLTFTLSAEETLSSYGTGTALVPTELVFVPSYTTGEKLQKAALNTLMGMGTVFLVLIFISIIIASLKNVNKLEASLKAKKAAKETASAPAPAAAPAPAPAPAPAAAPAPAPVEVPVAVEEDVTDDLELVAVITAAIAASADTPVEGLVVRSIKRKSASNWKNA